MPAVLSKVRDEFVKNYSRLPAPAVYGCAVLTAAAVGAVGYKLLKRKSKKPTSRSLIRKGRTNRHINNNYSKIGVEDCVTPTTCATKDEDEKCDACRALEDDCENVSEDDDSSPKLLKSLGARVPGLNMEFIKQIILLVRNMVPKLYCRETGLLAVHTLCLFTTTFLSIYVASMEGSIVKYIVKKDVNNFLLMLMKWFGIAIPATFITSMIRYLENKLALAFRSRLVDHAYRMYFKNQTYYRVSNLDNRIENADHSPSVPTPVLGASIPFGETSQNQSQQNAAFKFGSQSSSQPPAMGCGQAPAAGSSAPVFYFGSGSAAPPSNSQFNFSMGTPSSSAFSAPGLRAALRFKKVIRRRNIR